MPFKKAFRKYNNSKRKTAKKYGTTVNTANASARVIQAMIKNTLYKTLETKHSLSSSNDGVEIGHNSFVFCINNLLLTNQGTAAFSV